MRCKKGREKSYRSEEEEGSDLLGDKATLVVTEKRMGQIVTDVKTLLSLSLLPIHLVIFKFGAKLSNEEDPVGTGKAERNFK